MNMTEIDKEITNVKNTLVCVPFSSVRVMKPVATELLRRNDTLIFNGYVRYFQIKNLGLGVCEIRLRPISKINTFTVKDWEM